MLVSGDASLNGRLYVSGPLNVYRSTAGTIATLYGNGIGGNAYNLDFCSYINPSGTPTNRISVIDDGAYSAHLTFSSKTAGSENNTINEWMRIKSNGYVGIGTTNPNASLTIIGNNSSVNNRQITVGSNYPVSTLNDRIGALSFTDNNNQYEHARIESCNNAGAVDNSSDLRFFTRGDYITFTEKMRIDRNGYVGIGITNPAFPLHVTPYFVNANITTGYWFYNNTVGASNTLVSAAVTNTPTPWVSIKADHYIWANDGFIASSDSRIKTNITDINDASALSMLRLIKPRMFSYVDTVKKGSTPVYGFIAQEVNEIMPYSVVNNTTDFIPNIYEIGEISSDGYKVTLFNKSTNDISLNYSPLIMKFYDKSNKTIEKEIDQIIDTNNFTVKVAFNNDDMSGNQIFVYGQQVNDFNALNKEDIYTVTTAAVQDIDRIVQSQQQTIQTQQTQIQVLESKLTAIEARLSAANL